MDRDNLAANPQPRLRQLEADQARTALVMGLGRSGTTFLAKLIDSAPEVLYRHEPDAVLPTDLPIYVHRDDIPGHLATAKAYVQAMASCRRWRAADHLPIFPKAYRSMPAGIAHRALVLSTKLAKKSGFAPWDSLLDLIDRGGNLLHLIKSVSALGRARLFAEAVPDLRMIHIIRHPCAVCASLKVGIQRGVMGSKVSLKPLFAQKEAENYRLSPKEITEATFEEQVAYRWMFANDKAAADMAEMSSYLQIRYEDLCTDVEAVSEKIFSHLGLKRGAQTLRFISDISDAAAHDRPNVGYFRVKRPITSAVGKWKNQLDAETVERIRRTVSHSPLGRRYFEEP